MQVHPIIQELLTDIDAFAKREGISISEFGLRAIGDPNLYRDLKVEGRSPRVVTLDRIRSFIDGVSA